MLKQQYKKVFKFQKEASPQLLIENDRPISSSTNRSKNSFLVEVDHNYDIDHKIRHDIETRFKKSSMNANYKFPRGSLNDSKVLPKIKIDRRNLSEYESTLNSLETKKYRIK